MDDARLLPTASLLVSPESCEVQLPGNKINNNANSRGRVVFFFGLLVVVSNCGLLISLPLWLDSTQDARLIHHSNVSQKSMHWERGEESDTSILKLNNQRSDADEFSHRHVSIGRIDIVSDPGQNTSFPMSNVTKGPDRSHRIAVSFSLVLSSVVTVIGFGVIVLILSKCYPGKYITEREYCYPKSQCVKAGIFSSLNGIMIVYASRGSRTAPYLQSILLNATIPITFITRFILLRKRPTRRKVVCAAVVVLGVLLALITTIFPSLEPASAKRAEGGAQHGSGRVLWPICYTLGWVPFAICCCLMESNLKGEKKVYTASAHVNPFYFLFWQFLTAMIMFVAFLWVDIIPGFGTSPSITAYGKSLWFTIQCTLGGADCPSSVGVVALINCLSLFMVNLSSALFLKHTEGTNLLAITNSLCTPVVLLFWTLFVESPFHWAPHVQLSTWLSLAAVCIIIPAICVYNTGRPEMVLTDRAESPNAPKYGSTDIIS